MKKLFTIVFLLVVTVISAQITYIPDYYFEVYLVATGIDTDGEINGQVLTADIAEVTQLPLITNHEITDLTGIEDFESLEILDLYKMDLLEIDLSHNLNIRHLNISDVSLVSLDISANVNLDIFFLALNYSEGDYTSPITEIDVSNNTLLHAFRVSNTLITEIDVSNNINLQVLFIENTQALTTLNINNSNNLELTLVEIEDNPNLTCLQVDDPEAVIEGVVPPYDSWFIENNPLLTITDDCNLGIGDITLNNHIKLYPNPVIEVLNIENNSSYSINKLQIYDVLGRLVLQEKNLTGQIDVSNLASGLLFVHLETDGGVITKKVIKE